MSSPQPPSAGTTRGATSAGAAPGRSRTKLLWIGLAALAALVALLLLLSQCGGSDDDPADGAASTGAASASSGESSGASSDESAGASTSVGSSGGSTGGAEVAAGAPSSLVAADGTAVLDPAAPADPTPVLGAVSGQQVTGTAVQVLSVPADEGFWIGSSDTQRVWVQLTGTTGESPYQVRQGDRVDLTGTVVAHDAGFPATVGVDDAEGAATLTAQAQHVEVDRAALVLS